MDLKGTLGSELVFNKSMVPQAYEHHCHEHTLFVLKGVQQPLEISIPGFV